jgi:Fe-S-cluster containining protein
MDRPEEACRCGLCCQHFLIEATAADARREPRIAELGAPIPHDDDSGKPAGYVLNRGAVAGGACLFLDFEGERAVCGIYATRPEVCRRFECAGDGRLRLLALGLRLPDSPIEG